MNDWSLIALRLFPCGQAGLLLIRQALHFTKTAKLIRFVLTVYRAARVSVFDRVSVSHLVLYHGPLSGTSID